MQVNRNEGMGFVLGKGSGVFLYRELAFISSQLTI